MSALFRRRWRVQVGTLVVSDLDLTFKVKRTLAARPGTCELEVFNLSPTHRAELGQAGRTLVQVDAGYEGAVSMIFRGDLRRAESKLDGTTWTTKVTAGDGEYAIRNARVSRSFAAGSTVEAVVRHIAESMGVGIGNAVEVLSRATFADGGAAFEDGTALHGSASAELTRLCASARLSWSVQDQALQLIPLGRSVQREAIRLSPETGLLGSPERSRGSKLKVKALLIPDLIPGRLVVVDSRTAQGTYRIETTEYAGDTRGDDWCAALELREMRSER